MYFSLLCTWDYKISSHFWSCFAEVFGCLKIEMIILDEFSGVTGYIRRKYINAHEKSIF